ncbi:MAG: geranylgeranylglycerol-phosphate geranylgeranyltransferase [Candidatus Cloacimonetes bacterium]|nr:geranylgeranylglycerol-phosphate geranylgeranyltransferase [Candidatus Cloacimonadota bacterium]
MKPVAYLRILRPSNLVFIALTVLFGAFFRASVQWSLPVLAAVLSAVCIGGAGYAMNDFFDIPIDMVNRPKRVLPSGQISPRSAYLWAVFLFILGMFISLLTGLWVCVLLATLNSFLLFFYARNLKKTFLAGNIVVAYSAASTFLYGGLAAGNAANSLIIASYAFLYTIMRELVKDMEDIEGDSADGAFTLAVKLGLRRTVSISMLFCLLLVMLSLVSLGSGWLPPIFYVLLALFVVLPLLAFHTWMWRQPEQWVFARVSWWMKLDMLALLAIMWFAGAPGS